TATATESSASAAAATGVVPAAASGVVPSLALVGLGVGVRAGLLGEPLRRDLTGSLGDGPLLVGTGDGRCGPVLREVGGLLELVVGHREVQVGIIVEVESHSTTGDRRVHALVLEHR